MSDAALAQGTAPAPASVAAAAAQYPSAGRAWYTVGLLMLVYVLSFVDRQGISLLVGPIRQDLGIGDTGMSLLIGLAFALFYATLGLPAGLIADRGSRRLLIGGGLLLWSVATACTGLSANYGQLFAARLLVGVGEATLMPAAFSLIRDSFPAERRGTAYGVYTMGLMVGAGMAFLTGGLLIGSLVRAGSVTLPLLGELKPWRAMLVVTGLAGLPACALLLTLREPPRQPDPHAAAATARPSLAEALGHVWAHRALYLPFVAAIGIAGIVANGLLTWMPSVIGRTWHLPSSEIGVRYGLFLLLLAPVGLVGTGAVIDRLTRRGVRAPGTLAGGVLGAAILPLVAAAPVAPGADAMWALLALYILVGTGIQPAAVTVLSALTPGRLLGQVTALYFLTITVIAVLVGPTLIAGLSDYVLGGGPDSLGRALAIVLGVSTALSAALFFLTAHRQRRRAAVTAP